LHNSAMPLRHASRIKTEIEKWLPDCIESIACVLRKTVGRMSAFQVSLSLSLSL
jgi:hypothetical protein